MVQSPSALSCNVEHHAGNACQRITALKALGDIEVVREVEMVLQEEQDLTMLGRAHGKAKNN